MTNLVSAVMFDYRGLDTLVEEFILFASAMGVALLLRSSRNVAEQRPRDIVTSAAVRTAGSVLAPVMLLFGLWVIAFGYVTPGGGFQGGVVASGGALMLWLADSYRTVRDLSPSSDSPPVRRFSSTPSRSGRRARWLPVARSPR